jgi:hypothetical protein
MKAIKLVTSTGPYARFEHIIPRYDVWNPLVKLSKTTSDPDVRDKAISLLSGLNTASGDRLKAEAEIFLRKNPSIMNTLFDIPPTPPVDKLHYSDKFCRTCKHRQRWQCNSKVIQYCEMQKSNRTFNGLKKIKASDKACIKFYEAEL